MKPENRKIFEDNKIHWETLTKAGYLKHLSGRERSDLVKAFSEEFQPGYHADLWCPNCVANMITYVYRFYFEYIEKEKAAAQVQQIQQPEPVTPVIEPEKPAEPVQIAASFPVNDPPAEPAADAIPSPKTVQRKPNHQRR